ncbi:hypothetical protein K2173_020307 [Erythroxylum novogranatense]|uniref:Ninja-family protein n=1 Tax=Erythroxylum novogranatense TaxID=1862640 RepID=A0AAV8U7R8_9ROSI|nr:hypothetical protein K2173_020307 [Erythroxylum novogranatense]
MNIKSFSADLLQPFMSGSHQETEERDEVELSLGLSMNGKFGVDPRAKKLTKSCSIPDFVNTIRGNDSDCVVHVASKDLVRACSLPVDTEDETKKRKELQSLRRMEAKRKRTEKQRNLKAVKDRNKGFREECWEDCKRVPLSQGSIGSQGTGSSGITESECRLVQGRNQYGDASPASVQSFSEHDRKLLVTPKFLTSENSCSPVKLDEKYSKHVVNYTKTKEITSTGLEEMPSVSTRGDGPNGKRIDGFLYRYGKGEEVKIVCVCHGSFLSPSEFIKHAGGGDIAHPLRHIVVNPSPLL